MISETKTKNPRDAEKSPPRSEGQRLLREAGTIAEIAAETELSTRSVGSYRGGSATPGDEARIKIATAYPHIAPVNWDRPPNPPAPRPLPSPWLDHALDALQEYPAARDRLVGVAAGCESKWPDGSPLEALRLRAVTAELEYERALQEWGE